MKQINDHINWEDCIIVGIPLVDKQHHNLLRMTKKLYIACNDEDETSNIFPYDTIHEIMDNMATHFQTEEKLMVLLQYKGLINHKQIHEDIFRKITVETSLFSMGKIYIPKLFINSLKELFLSHIAIHDLKIAEQIRNMKDFGKFEMLLAKKQEEIKIGVKP